MLSRHQTVAVAESVTAGTLQWAFSHAVDASLFFEGGITLYNISQKVTRLHVDERHAKEVNSVSQQVADEMAINVCKLFNCNWGIGITGYCTPVKESDFKVFAFYSIAHNASVQEGSILYTPLSQPGDIQLDYCNQVLKRFEFLLT